MVTIRVASAQLLATPDPVGLIGFAKVFKTIPTTIETGHAPRARYATWRCLWNIREESGGSDKARDPR